MRAVFSKYFKKGKFSASFPVLIPARFFPMPPVSALGPLLRFLRS
jgi:hypothetical protein